MGSENGLKKTLYRKLRGLWIPTDIESPCSPGVPDIYYTNRVYKRMGWVELKYIHRWPINSQRILKVEHFTPQQKNWIRLNHKAGARVFLMIQVGKDYLIFDGETAQNVGAMNKHEMFVMALKSWSNRINSQELIKIF
ncbi:MAG: hypothetical protein RBS96_02535 [Dehalococcoidales bacterium]|jgi:hypothetical protein|nr:hypothetical protein [Syntrophales bacterium]MDX9802893.1 hypothetical protein [Dehalococcoidales bacterium]